MGVCSSGALWVSLDLAIRSACSSRTANALEADLIPTPSGTRRMLVLLSNEEYDNARQRALHFTIAPAHTME
jgi:hypothetical protein